MMFHRFTTTVSLIAAFVCPPSVLGQPSVRAIDDPERSPLGVVFSHEGGDAARLDLIDRSFEPIASRPVGDLVGWAWRPEVPALLAIAEAVGSSSDGSCHRVTILSGRDLSPVAPSFVVEEVETGGALGWSGVFAFAGAEGEVLLVNRVSAWSVGCHAFDLGSLTTTAPPARHRWDGIVIGGDLAYDSSLVGVSDDHVATFIWEEYVAFLDLSTGDGQQVRTFSRHGIMGHPNPSYEAAASVDGVMHFALSEDRRLAIGKARGGRSQELIGYGFAPDEQIIPKVSTVRVAALEDGVRLFVLGGDWPAARLQIFDVEVGPPGVILDVALATRFVVDPNGRVALWNHVAGSARAGHRSIVRIPVQPGVEQEEIARLPVGAREVLLVGEL